MPRITTMIETNNSYAQNFEDDSSSSSIAPISILAYIIASFIANAGVSITGFGMALIFVFIYTIFDVLGWMQCPSSSSSSNHYYNMDNHNNVMNMCDMKYAVFIQSLSLVGAIPFLIIKTNVRQNANYELLFMLIPVTIVSTPLGQLSQNYIGSSWIRIVVGVVITIVVGWEIVKHCKAKEEEMFVSAHDDDEEEEARNSTSVGSTEQEISLVTTTVGQNYGTTETSQEQLLLPSTITDAVILSSSPSSPSSLDMYCWGFILGLFSGYLGGLIGMRGPPLMIFFLYFSFPKQEARAVGAIMLGLNMLIRIIVYLLEDYTSASKEEEENHWFQWEKAWRLYIGVIVAGILGVPIGDYIHKHYIDQDKFRFALAILLAVSGILNIVKGCLEIHDFRIQK